MATTQVKNIQDINHDIPDFVTEMCKKIGVLDYIPKTVPKSLSFELHNTTSAVANAFRRCINDELEVLLMYFDTHDLICTDPFIISREVQRSINLIPIKQISNMVFSINVYNDTNDIMYITSRDIKENGKSTEDKFSQTFIIAELKPGREFKIKNIKIKSGIGFKDGAKFSFPDRVGYECLDLDINDFKSSMEVEPTQYKLTIKNQQFTEPRTIIKYAAKTLEQKLEVIGKLVEEYQSSSIRSSTKLEIYKDGTMTRYKIYDETYTIGNLIVKYIYDTDPSIKIVSCVKKFTSDKFIIINVKHPDADTLISKSIERAKKEINAVGIAF
jgi:DNA-directed RNA polymerase subunit L